MYVLAGHAGTWMGGPLCGERLDVGIGAVSGVAAGPDRAEGLVGALAAQVAYLDGEQSRAGVAGCRAELASARVIRRRVWLVRAQVERR
jgi:hypothetical protein